MGIRSALARGTVFLVKAAVPVGILAGAVYGFAYLQATRPAVPVRPPVEDAVPVSTMTVAFEDHRPDLRLYGEVEAGQRLELIALVDGVVDEISPNLRDGALVEEGELLFEVDRFRYEVALAEAKQRLVEATGRLAELELQLKGDRDRLALTRNQLQIAERDYERASRLVESSTVAESTLDVRELAVLEQRQAFTNQRNQVEVRQALIAQQKAVRERLRQTVMLAERDLEDTRVFAPFDGFLDNVTAEVGRRVNRNEQVGELLDADWLQVSFVMSNSQLGRITAGEGSLIGRAVTVNWNLGADTLQYTARVERIGAAIDAESGGVEVFARLENIDETSLLRAGAFVEVVVPDRVYQNVVRAPEAAVYEGRQVFVVGGNERLEAREVTLLGRDGEAVFLAGDVAPGERILTMRLPGVGEGLKVLPVETVEAGRGEGL